MISVNRGYKRLSGYLVAIAISGLLSACNKSSNDNSSPAPAPVVTQYGYVNGVCHNLTNNTQAPANMCPPVAAGNRFDGVNCYNSANQIIPREQCNGLPGQLPGQSGGVTPGYQLVGGICYSTFTWTMVNYSLCSGYPGYVAGSCQGYYWQVSEYAAIQIYCYGTNCRGQRLIEARTGNQVTCQ